MIDLRVGQRHVRGSGAVDRNQAVVDLVDGNVWVALVFRESDGHVYTDSLPA